MTDQSEHSIGRKLGRVGFSGPKPMPFPLLCFLFEDQSCPLCGPHMLGEAALCCAGLRANCVLLFSILRSVVLHRLLKIIHGRNIHSTGIGKSCTSLFVGLLLLLSVCLFLGEPGAIHLPAGHWIYANSGSTACGLGLSKQHERARISHSVMSNSLRPHGSFVHGILQARILQWVAILFSRGSS